MKKFLTLQEIAASDWGKRIREELGEDLQSAFLHGNCLYEGFDAIHEKWRVSVILKDFRPGELSAVHGFRRKMAAENMEFGYFFSESFLESGKDDYPLEFLHISRRNVPLFGAAPLADFLPDENALRAECRRELKSRGLHLVGEFTRIQSGISPMDFFIELNSEILPILYGIYFLRQKSYPKTREEVLSLFPEFRVDEPALDFKQNAERANACFAAIEKLVQTI